VLKITPHALRNKPI